MLPVLLLLGAGANLALGQHSAEEWKSRTIYQLLTDRFAKPDGSGGGGCANLGDYCGGTFQGILKRLDYIQNMGFDAIWISPIVANSPGGYHGYWAQDFYQVNPHFGSQSDLVQLVDECHRRGIWVMADIVANHVAPVGTDFSGISPFNQASHYHPECAVSEYTCFTDQVLRCRLAGLPDLDQNNTYVRQELLKWAKWLGSTFAFDGLRADTVMYISPGFWQEFRQAAGMYIVGEVYSDLGCNVAYQQSAAVDATLSYPMYFAARNVFQSGGSMTQLGDTTRAYDAFPHPEYEGSFMDNHDNPRFLYGHTNAETQYANALAWTVLSRGIPIVYYGTEQGFSGGSDPNCREPLWSSNYDQTSHFYGLLKALIGVRKQQQVWSYAQQEFYSSGPFYCFVRGPVLVALANQVRDVSQGVSNLPFTNGETLCDALNSADCITVNNGFAQIVLTGGYPKVYVSGKPRPPTCDPNQRRDCGYVGVTQQQCEAKGCCWLPVNPNPQNLPWCVYHANATAVA